MPYYTCSNALLAAALLFYLHCQKALYSGLPARGENGQGMETRITMNARLNQTAIVLNFSLSAFLRLATAEPMVINTTDVNIITPCSMPKNRISLS